MSRLSLEARRMEATRAYYEAKGALDRGWNDIALPGMSVLEILEAMTSRTSDQHAENDRWARQMSQAEDELQTLQEAF